MLKNIVYIGKKYYLCSQIGCGMKFVRTILVVMVAMCCMSFTVVIDAGHGGNDAGAIGHVLKIKEKDLNLSVAQRLADKIRQHYPEVNVVMTRTTDVFLPLQQRADIVNKNHADLFICVHTNAAENRKACGAETFILGTDRMEDNLDVAMRENAVMKLEADQTVYQGFDPNSPESYIMFTLYQNAFLEKSLNFAEYIQKQYKSRIKTIDRGVKQGELFVLYKTSMPAVLTEIGFISNPKEEEYMMTEEGQNEYVYCIASAFAQYKASEEGSTLVEIPAPKRNKKSITPQKQESEEKRKRYACQCFGMA